MDSDKQVITDRQIAALKVRESRYIVKIGNAPNLWLRVSKAGLKSFEFVYDAPNGMRRRMWIGDYPETTLRRATTEAGEYRAQVAKGGDPGADRQQVKHAARNGERLEDLFGRYEAAALIGLHGGRKKPKKPQTLANECGLLKKHIKPTPLGDKAVAAIKRADIRDYMNRLAAKSGLSANSVARIGDLLSSLFGYLVHIGEREDNPVRGLAHPISLAGTSRDRRFDDNGLKMLWTNLVTHSVDHEKGDGRGGDSLSRLAPETALALRLVMVTLTRRSEAAGARWSEINRKYKVWEIPGNRTKHRRVHVVPLSDAALAILATARVRWPESQFVFPSPDDPQTPLDAGQINRAVKRLCKRLGIPHGSPHDFRRSGATTLTRHMKFTRFHVGCVLGHQVRDGAAVTAVYDRYEYLDEKRRALDAWANYLLDIAEGRDNVVTFPASASLPVAVS